MKLTLAVAVVLSLATFSACNSKSPTAAQSSQPDDAVQQKLQELAGGGATNCGSPKSQNPSEVQPASDCAVKAAQNKQPFYVRYDLPGMTTAMAGNAQGQLYAVQSEGGGQVQSTPCPAQIRMAQSGRVTCYAMGSMGAMGGAAGTNPHGGMEMGPATGPNPHEGMAMPSHGTQQTTKPKKQ